MGFESKITFKLSSTQNEDVSGEGIFSITHLAVFGASMLFFSNNALRAHFSCKGFGLLFQPFLLRILLKNISKGSCENFYVKTYSKAEVFLYISLSAIAKSDCADVPKPIRNVFLGPSMIFFPAASVSVFKYCIELFT